MPITNTYIFIYIFLLHKTCCDRFDDRMKITQVYSFGAKTEAKARV